MVDRVVPGQYSPASTNNRGALLVRIGLALIAFITKVHAIPDIGFEVAVQRSMITGGRHRLRRCSQATAEGREIIKCCFVVCGVVTGLTACSAWSQVSATGLPVAAEPVTVGQPDPRAAAVDNSFTYQGYLEDAGAAANGAYDIRFTLYDDAGAIVAGPICRDNVQVVDGL